MKVSALSLIVVFGLIFTTLLLMSVSEARAGIIGTHASVWGGGDFQPPQPSFNFSASGPLSAADSGSYPGQQGQTAGFDVRAGSATGRFSPASLLTSFVEAIVPASPDMGYRAAVDTHAQWYDGLTIPNLDRPYQVTMVFGVSADVEAPGQNTGSNEYLWLTVNGPTSGNCALSVTNGGVIWATGSYEQDNGMGHFEGALSISFTLHPDDHFFNYDWSNPAWSPYGSVPFYIDLETRASTLTGTSAVDARNTVALESVLLQNSQGQWVTPESLGFGVEFDSGLPSPNIPEPATLLLLGLGAVMLRRKRS